MAIEGEGNGKCCVILDNGRVMDAATCSIITVSEDGWRMGKEEATDWAVTRPNCLADNYLS